MKQRQVLLLFLHFILICPAQIIQGQGIRKNSIFIEGETIILFGNYSINYDRTFLPDKYVHLSLGAGFGRGYILLPGSSEHDPLLSSDRGFAYKIKGSCILDFGLEIIVGYTFVHEKGFEVFNWPHFSIGYRYMRDFEFWRIYLGTWGLGVSAGISF